MISVSILNLLQGMVSIDNDSTDAIRHASLFLTKCNPKFISSDERLIYQAIIDSVKSQVPLDLDIFQNFLKQQSIDDKERLIYLRKFAESIKIRASHEKFIALLNNYQYQIQKQIFTEKLLSASFALDKGYFDEETKILYEGLGGAQELVSQAIFDSSESSLERFPSGNVFDDKDEILKDYKNATEGKTQGDIKFGFNVIDNLLGGASKGEMILIGAYTGEGKSMLITNIAHNVAVVQSKNAVVVTAEVLRPQYRRRLLGRHSCLPRFGLPLGIPTNDIKRGLLKSDMLQKFQEVVDDFTSNPNYGYLNVCQVTQGATLREVRNELEAINSQIPIDVVFLDYLSLLRANRSRSRKQEETVELLREAKELAITFNSGKGLVVVSAHQFSAQARERVQPLAGKFYTVRDFADTSEAGKSCDIALGLLRTDELKAQHEICMGFLKVRDNEVGPLFNLFENFTASYLSDLTAGTEVAI